MALGTAAEWAVRVPFCLLGVLGLYGVYLVTARLAGRRAGVFAAVVTGTCPMFALVARQAMTDMTLVGPVTLALALAPWPCSIGTSANCPAAAAASGAGRTTRCSTARSACSCLITVPQLLVDSIHLRVRALGRTPGHHVRRGGR